MRKPLAIELFAGLFGWGEGLIAEGYETLGFDIVNMFAEIGTERRPEFNLVLQSVLTLHGAQFKDAALIVASPPCQEYSYMAMPWSLAKQKRREYLDGTRDKADLTALFDACFRIQREAIEAAGHFIPLVVENVRGAIPWVGRSRWNYGSFHLWGDVPALMPMTKAIKNNGGSWFNIGSPGQKETNRKVPGFRFDGSGKSFQTASVEGTKVSGLNWSNYGKPGYKAEAFNSTAQSRMNNEGVKLPGNNSPDNWTNPAENDGVKQAGISGVRNNGKGDCWFQDGAARHGSKSNARKAASAAIAKIPLPLAKHIARYWLPS